MNDDSLTSKIHHDLIPINVHPILVEYLRIYAKSRLLEGSGEWRVRVLESPLAERLGLVPEGKRQASLHATLRLDLQAFQLLPLEKADEKKKHKDKAKENRHKKQQGAEDRYMSSDQLNTFDLLFWPLPLVRR